jgi:hypothetical protein
LTSAATSANNKPPGKSHAFQVLAFTSSGYGRRGREAMMFRARASQFSVLGSQYLVEKLLPRTGN